MRKTTALLAFSMAFGLAAPTLAQNDCSALPVPENGLKDGQLFYSKAGKWLLLTAQEQLEIAPPRTIKFLYVVREDLTPERAGVLVIKTGRMSSGSGRNVALEREASAVNEGTKCALIEPFQSTSLPSDSYDRYHDYGYLVDEKDILTRFHVEYRARQSRCVRTDDSMVDSALPLFGDRRSNRSQFSFDEGVVRGGMFRQVFAFLGPRRALASEGMTDQRVEMLPYSIGESGKVACMRFKVRVTGDRFFLRVNDLEGRDPLAFLRRADEHSWTLLD